jgi:hypothetical protein
MTDEDPRRTTDELVNQSARPLTEDERKAADRDQGVAERVYAPASERVPRTVEGHRDVIENTDSGTPERQAASQASTSPTWTPDAEPSFTRVPRPSDSPPSDAETGDYSHDVDWSPQGNRWMSNMPASGAWPMGMGWLTVGIMGGVGVWLWMRWQRERNRPINRLRRQARQTASQARARATELYDQMPDFPEFPDEARRPAAGAGLGTALLSLAIVLWRVSQTRSQTEEARAQADQASRKVRQRADKTSRQASDTGRQAAQAMADLDWQERLTLLRELWRERSPVNR